MARNKFITPGLAACLLMVCAHSAAAGDFVASAGGSTPRISVVSMKERKFATVVRQQYDFSCGSAALATLLTHHYERPTSEADAFKVMWDVGDQARIRKLGFSLLEMKRFLEAKGMRADGFKMTIERVRDVGVPGVALINEGGYQHFVVVKGVARGKVLIGDPARGLRTMNFEQFSRQWDGTILFVRSDVAVGKDSFNNRRDWRLTPFGPSDRALDNETLQAAHLDQTRSLFSGFSVLAQGSSIR